MGETNSGSHGIKWGLIIGVVYWICLFLRFKLGAANAAFFGLFALIGFIIVVVLLFFCGSTFRKQNGGYLEMKEAFKVMFIAILIFEAFYSVFTFVYLRYIDPAFFDKFKLSTEAILSATGQPQSDVDKVLEGIDNWGEQARRLNIFDFLRSYLTNVAIIGVFALIYSLILKRKPPVSYQ